jgi:hypothetical protein
MRRAISAAPRSVSRFRASAFSTARTLTPDPETGLGNWTPEQTVAALQSGKRPDGRVLAPIMPWKALANLTKDDATAIALFLKSLPPVRNKVPGPFGAGETPTSFVMKIVPPQKN